MEESILSIRSILQCHPSSVPKILPRLIPLLASPDTVAPRALESIYWLCSLYFTEHYSVANQIPNILRLSAIAFPSHASSVKLQILSLAVKFCKLQKDDTNRAQSILGFLLEMARFDADLDVRDKARFWSALITSPVLVKYPKFITQWIKSIRGVKTSNILSESKNGGSSHQFTIGSLSFARNRKLAGYIPLPPFPESQVPSKRGKMAQDFQTRAGDSSISSAAQALRSQSSETAKPMKTVKLEDFYSESEEESSSALEESSEEEETDSDEDDEEEVRAS